MTTTFHLHPVFQRVFLSHEFSFVLFLKMISDSIFRASGQILDNDSHSIIIYLNFGELFL
jgi:hypothetical protein